MNMLTKLFAPAGLALAALAAVPAQAQVEGRLATVDVSRTVLGTNALKTAYEQIGQTYSAQAELGRNKAKERQTLLATFDKNGDKQVDDAELEAKRNTPDFAKLQTLDQEIQAIGNQIDGARVYAIEQILRQYGAALEEVIKARQIKLVVDPGSLLYAPPEADITEAVTAALNTKVPSVGVVPPTDWRPSREGLQIFQEIQQRLIAAQIAQQQAAAAQQQQGNPSAPVGR